MTDLPGEDPWHKPDTISLDYMVGEQKRRLADIYAPASIFGATGPNSVHFDIG
jgi:hypothetical protein